VKPTDKGKQLDIPVVTLAEQAGLSCALALDPGAMEAAMKRGLQPLSPLPNGYSPTTEPALGFKARA
jgi:hypothetical protein